MKKDFVYLASASPRRSELLRQIGVRFTVRAAAIDENQLPGERPEAYVARLAAAKAETVSAATADSTPVLGADTAVVLDGDPLVMAGRSFELLDGIVLSQRRRRDEHPRGQEGKMTHVYLRISGPR